MGPSVAAAKVLLSVGNPYFREARAQNGHGFDPMRTAECNPMLSAFQPVFSLGVKRGEGAHL